MLLALPDTRLDFDLSPGAALERLILPVDAKFIILWRQPSRLGFTVQIIQNRAAMMEAIQDLDTIFAEILGLPVQEINDSVTPESCAHWDSLNHLRLVTEIEARFGVEFTMAEVQAALSVGEFRQLIAKHQT